MKYLDLLMEYYNCSDRRTRVRWGVGLACLLLLALLVTGLNTRVSLLVKKRNAREADVTEMLILKQRYLEANLGSQKLANRMAATRPDDSPAKIIDEIGIKGKGSQFKQVRSETHGGYAEDGAEARIESLTANEAINLIYKLENGTKPVVIKKALFKTRFDDPAKLDLTLTLALLKSTSPGQK